MGQDPVRIDKWLWAARLAKTRALATEAINGGRVHLNGARVKPGKDVKPGDRVEVTLAQGRRIEAIVNATAERRGSAKEAALLYEETPESVEAGRRHAAERRLAATAGPPGGPRPTKRDRRRLEATRGRR